MPSLIWSRQYDSTGHESSATTYGSPLWLNVETWKKCEPDSHRQSSSAAAVGCVTVPGVASCPSTANDSNTDSKITLPSSPTR